MKRFITLATVGVTGYLIGVFEMKYRILKSFYENVKEEVESE